MKDFNMERMGDLTDKEIALFIHENRLKPTTKERIIIKLAFYRGANWGMGELVLRMEELEKKAGLD